MNNNDVWVVLSMQQTLGRPFCEQLSDNNWRRFGVPTRLPQPFVSAAQQRESDSKIPLSFEISGTVTQLSAAQKNLYGVAVFLEERGISQWLALRVRHELLPTTYPNESLSAEQPSVTLVSLIYTQQRPHFQITKLKPYSTY
ncbi:hypothetical protein BTVI_121979 [Pitangus sulphuratus]|nr:hypothetical protein BTVI_121979 [Pitangus sulphuratus]